MARLSVTLLGSFEVVYNGRAVADLNLEKAQALLVYLIVETDRAHRRAALASLLWPEAGEDRARASLRQVLHRLRLALGEVDAGQPIFLVTPRTVQFQRTVDDWIDVEAFTTLLNSCRTHPHARLDECPDCLARMRQAVDLYRGEFLADFTLPDSAPYQEWVVVKQAELHNRAVDALAFLAAIAEGSGQYDSAGRYAQRVLELEPWNEDAHRRRMSIYARNGQRAAALRQYEICHRTLVAELGVEPAPETKALHAQIRDGCRDQQPRSSSDRAGIPVSMRQPAASSTAISDEVFVDFRNELSILQDCLASTIAGHGQGVLVAGERGSGKSMLVAEFLRQAIQAHGSLLCAYGSARQPIDASNPYGLLREALITLTGSGSHILDHGATARLCAHHNQPGLQHVRQALAKAGIDTVESLLAVATTAEDRQSHAYDHSPVSLSSAAEGERVSLRSQAHLIDQIERLLRLVTQVHSVVFVFENVQWADVASLAVLRYLPSRLTDSRILFVLTYDSTAISDRARPGQRLLHAVINSLLIEASVCSIDLDQLDGRTFMDSFLRSASCDPHQAWCEELFHYTLGHPLFTVEMLHALMQDGSLVPDGSGHWIEGPRFKRTTTGAPDWGRLPQRAAAIICERMARLSPECLALLEAAAVQGDVFYAEIAASAQGTEEETLTQCLSEVSGEGQRLISAEGVSLLGGQRVSRYRFRHPMVRKHLDDQLDAVHRSRLHEATARALERLTEAHSAEVAEQLAFHYEAADIFGKAVRFRQLAAEAALERSEYQESFEQLRVGLALVPSMVDAHERLEAELQLQLDLNVALAVIYGRGAERRREACERAFELCQSVGAWSASFWTRYALADLAQCRADPAHAQELVEQLLALAHQGNESAMISLAEVSMAEAYFLSGNLLSAQRRLSCLLDSTVARGFARLRGKTGLDMGSVGLSWLAWTRWSLGYADQASALADQALVLAEEHPLSQAHVLLLDHFCLDWISRQFDQALQAAARFEQLVNDQKSLTSMRPWLNIVRGWTCCYQHSADSGLAAIRQGIAEMEPTGATLMRSLQLLAWFILNHRHVNN
jgi:DNA-binding SARP family transcriptional activator/predicted ATPase